MEFYYTFVSNNRTMLVSYSKELSEEVGVKAAVLAHTIYMLQPHYNKAKLNLRGLSRDTDISLSTVHRIIKSLRSKGYLEKHRNSKYALTIKFFNDFYKDYIAYDHG